MEAAALVLAALLTVALVVFVARPFLRERGSLGDRLGDEDSVSADRLRLLEARDRALGALKELEFDQRTGKVSDADYRALVGPLRREAAEALRALETKEAAEPERTTVDAKS